MICHSMHLGGKAMDRAKFSEIHNSNYNVYMQSDNCGTGKFTKDIFSIDYSSI